MPDYPSVGSIEMATASVTQCLLRRKRASPDARTQLHLTLLDLHMVSGSATLLLNLQRAPLKVLRVVCLVSLLVMSRDQEGSIVEEVVHLLERKPGGLREEEVEEDGVGEVADNEEEVVPVADVRHRRIRDLTDEGVECEGYHGGDGHTFGSSPGVEYFGGDDPRQWSAGCGEGEVVEPCPAFCQQVVQAMYSSLSAYMIMKPHDADLLFDDPGGNSAGLCVSSPPLT